MTTDFYHLPGFLGTRATFGADIALILILFSSIMFTVGWRLAVHQHYAVHRWVQTSAAIINSAAVLAIMVGSFWGFVLPTLPTKLGEPVATITTIHAIIGAFTFLLGIFVVLRANQLVPSALRFKNYKIFMRTSYGLYMLSTLIGVVVYLVTYMLVP